jgi:hypothetical protein
MTDLLKCVILHVDFGVSLRERSWSKRVGTVTLRGNGKAYLVLQTKYALFTVLQHKATEHPRERDQGGVDT